MRMRLGLLQAPEDIDRQTAEVAAKKKKTSEVATAKTQAQSVLDDGEAGPSASKEKMKSSEKAKSKKLVHIRPLSEAKAIDSGANFISETFLFFVAGGLIVLERWYSNRRETSRREDIAERLASLELEEVELKSKITSLEADLTHLNDEKSSHHTLEASKAQGREEEARSLANV